MPGKEAHCSRAEKFYDANRLRARVEKELTEEMAGPRRTMELCCFAFVVQVMMYSLWGQ